MENARKALGLTITVANVVGQSAKIGEKRKINRNLAELFRENFLLPDGSLHERVLEVECAGLRLVRATVLTRRRTGQEYYLVRVVNDAKSGDDPTRVRRFGFFPKSGKIGFPPAWLEIH
ncbi:hypothetical protein [Frankia sp. QA3]|uniref:hypothetical protein n=1 Tax=Frankia sp. QA3 TaxID=710111 RepID=UPI000269C512|nr:hypothetical protein [Frankia sp. QA3]EIV94366.1 hypothetical protein FraQA3DRAFT_4118 [Frankia sp. QA3]